MGDGSRALLMLLMVLVSPAALAQGPVITEFVAVNEGGLQDEDYDSPDWIEIHNPGVSDLDLESLGLSDNPNKPRKWRFPAVSLPAKGYLIVYASGKNRRDPKQALHTNFQLAEEGDHLSLTTADGKTTLSQFPTKDAASTTYPKQRANRSYGLGPRGQLGFFESPTPGRANNAHVYQGLVAEVECDAPRGYYHKQFLATLSTATPNAKIRYTLDGSKPTPTSGKVYTDSIPVITTTVLRAIAYLPGHLSSEVTTLTYLFIEHVKQSRELSTSVTRHKEYGPKMSDSLTSLPSVSIITPRGTSGNRELPASIEMLFPNDDDRTAFQVPCGIKEFGGAFTHFRKKNFRLYFRGRHGASKLQFPVFESDGRPYAPTDSFDQLSLRSGSHDMISRGFYLSNRFTDDTMLDMGHLAPHGRFVHVYLNGRYWGQYHLRERWGASMLSQYLGGKKEHYEAINGNKNVGGWAWTSSREAYDGDGSTWDQLKDLALSNDASNYDAVKPYLDLTQLVDYMLLYMYGNAEDEFRAAGVAGPGSGFKFFFNDADGYFTDVFQPNRKRTAFQSNAPGVFGRANGDGPGSLFGLLYKAGHPDFRILVADRIQKHFFQGGALTPTQILVRLQTLADEIETSMVAEIARWRGQTYRLPNQWAAAKDQAMQHWIPGRTTWVMNQLRAAGFYPPVEAPAMSQASGTIKSNAPLKLSAPSGQIYYTMDGSDPRLSGGAMNPKAKLYEDGLARHVIVAKGAKWTFLDRGVPPPTGWNTLKFNDRRWGKGTAEFGYGDGDERTRVSFGTNRNRKQPTTYFRHVFNVPDISTAQTALIELKRDDGAIVYLNGKEVARSNIRRGAVAYRTYANKCQDDGRAFHSYSIPATHLKRGRNVLAVEVHQSSASSSDLSFDLQLSVTLRDPSVTATTLTVTQNSHLQTRAKLGETWSALNEAFFTVGNSTGIKPGDICVSELHYHPANNADTEFIEFANISNHTVNLRGITFTKGIAFTFPDRYDTLLAPNERLLLVEDRYAMDQTYQLGLPIVDQYTGSLDNGGEQIVLMAKDGETKLIDFTYNDSKGWPQEADGAGSSLVLTSNSSDPAVSSNWRASNVAGGTPGH